MRKCLISVLLCLPVGAQNTVAGAGYRNASPVLEAAPGQVLIVSLHGARARLSEPVPGTFTPATSLPRSAAGFSADLVRGEVRTPAGIYGVSQTACPAGIAACQPITNITLQIPFELAVNQFASVEVKEGGIVLAQLAVRGVWDKIHVISSCVESVVYYSLFGGETLDSCTAAVVRPMGGLNNPNIPARPGETLVAFAYGMGDADPSPIGRPFRAGRTKQPFVMRFAIAGGQVYWAQAPDAVVLITAGGTYQINFRVPPLPGDTPLPACGERGLYGNMRVSISGMHSTDTFELCVTQ